MKTISEYKDFTSICNNAPSEILSLIAMQNRKQILSRNLQIISDNLKILNTFFNKYKQLFEWQTPAAGPIYFPKLNTEISVNKFCKGLIKEHQTMLLPSSVYLPFIHKSEPTHFCINRYGMRRIERQLFHVLLQVCLYFCIILNLGLHSLRSFAQDY
jgi:hypothetical protein